LKDAVRSLFAQQPVIPLRCAQLFLGQPGFSLGAQSATGQPGGHHEKAEENSRKADQHALHGLRLA
jgi:hypothetical protein